MGNGLQDCSSNYFGSLLTYYGRVFGRIFHTRQPKYWQALGVSRVVRRIRRISYFCRWPVPWSSLENIIVVSSHYLLHRIVYGIFSPHGLPSLHGRVGYSTGLLFGISLFYVFFPDSVGFVLPQTGLWVIKIHTNLS